jgi:hypothetical protein
MSTRYNYSKDVPTETLVARLNEIVDALTACDHGESMRREMTMRIPAEVDRDADLVLDEAARRLIELTAERDALLAEVEEPQSADTVSRAEFNRMENAWRREVNHLRHTDDTVQQVLREALGLLQESLVKFRERSNEPTNLTKRIKALLAQEQSNDPQ